MEEKNQLNESADSAGSQGTLPALSSQANEFMMHFGEMGNYWGINRTVGQIYALLYVYERPLNADEIAELTHFSRSNVSMGLKELQSWNLIKLKYIRGDRKEYFTTPDDIWEIFRTLAIQRKKREIDPTLTMLRNSILQNSSTEKEYTSKKIKEMHDFLENISSWFEDIHTMNPEQLIKFMKMGRKVQKLIEFTKPNKKKNEDKTGE